MAPGFTREELREDLRAELERFAREGLRQELGTLRAGMVVASRPEPWKSETEAIPERRGSDAAFAESSPATGIGQRPPRKSMADHGEVAWATHRVGFNAPEEEDLTNFGRRRASCRGQAGGQPHRRWTRFNYVVAAKPEGLVQHEEGGEADGGAGASSGDLREMALGWGEAPPRPSMYAQARELAGELLTSELFAFAIGGLIVVNAIVIGFETEYMASRWCTEAPAGFRALDRLFCAVYLAELGLRLCARGAAFFTEASWRWNMLDLVLIALQLADETLKALAHGSRRAGAVEGLTGNELGALRTMRLFKLVRLLRLPRMLRSLGGLRMLVVSIADSIRSLAWTLILLFVMTFVFGVFLTQLVTDHKVRHKDAVGREEMEELLYCFGSLDRSMLCLYEAISEGVHWHEVVRPLMEQCGRWLAFLFILYMSFTLFALMNVVTGVFCESAIRTAAEDQKQVLMQQMHDLFLEADDDGSGTISAEEFEAHLKDPQMLMYLKAIDVNPEEARHLFALLDTEEEGEIEAEALVNGCLRLQGSAKAIELAAFMQEHKVEYQRLRDHAEKMERSMSYLCQNVGRAT